jgi:hypothetical protein
MRTKSELQREAQRLEQQWLESQRQLPGGTGAVTIGASSTIPLLTFPESSVRLTGHSDFGTSVTHRMVRYILAAHDRTSPEYVLIEEESVTDSEGRLVRRYDPVELARSRSALDVVSAGYQRIDADHLQERLEPIAARIAANGFTQNEWDDALSRVKALTSDLALSPAAQMRVKTDAIDLMEGRLELGDFVARTVARQDCFDPAQRVELTREIRESIEV